MAHGLLARPRRPFGASASEVRRYGFGAHCTRRLAVPFGRLLVVQSITSISGLRCATATMAEAAPAASVRRLDTLPRQFAMDTMDCLRSSGKIRRGPTECDVPDVSTVRGLDGLYKQYQIKTRVAGVRSRGRLGAAYKAAPGWEGIRMLVHQISYLAATGERLPAGFDVSHLCGNACCCNPDHLVAESHADNMSRQRCLGTVVGVLPCGHAGCAETHYFEKVVCAHAPACLTRTPL